MSPAFQSHVHIRNECSAIYVYTERVIPVFGMYMHELDRYRIVGIKEELGMLGVARCC